VNTAALIDAKARTERTRAAIWSSARCVTDVSGLLKVDQFQILQSITQCL
jgi:hypothetical protein